jgi:hypothetical protein
MTVLIVTDYPEIEQEIVDTNAAAAFLNRKPQTLRKWACLKVGPIQPVRVYGRLGWRRSELLALITGTVKTEA